MVQRREESCVVRERMVFSEGEVSIAIGGDGGRAVGGDGGVSWGCGMGEEGLESASTARSHSPSDSAGVMSPAARPGCAVPGLGQGLCFEGGASIVARRFVAHVDTFTIQRVCGQRDEEGPYVCMYVYVQQFHPAPKRRTVEPIRSPGPYISVRDASFTWGGGG